MTFGIRPGWDNTRIRKRYETKKVWRKTIWVFVLLCFTTVLAQDTDCSVMIQQALTELQQDCAATGRNQVCYGHDKLDIKPRKGAPELTFQQRGDIVSVADLDSLRLSPLDEATDQWGIALMKLQADLPDRFLSQNVTFLLFGEVEVRNAVAPVDPNIIPPQISVSANHDTPILDMPSSSGAVLSTLYTDDPGMASGLSADGKWIRITSLKDNKLGWVSLADVRTTDDLSQLGVVDAVTYTPMQAFSFTTGSRSTGCTEAPKDGILVSSPSDMGMVHLRANEVDLQLASTLYLQAQPNGVMTVTVIEGQAEVTASGTTVTVPAGTQVTVPMDANLSPSGPPSATQPNDPAQTDSLPVDALYAIADPYSIGTPEPTPVDCKTQLKNIIADKDNGLDDDATPAEVEKKLESRIEALIDNDLSGPDEMDDAQALQSQLDDLKKCFK